MDAKVTWKGELAFEGIADRGFSLPLDSNVGGRGESKGFGPFELVALGLAGCTAMDVISILEKKHQDVTAFEVKVHGERASEHPRVFTCLRIEYHITGRNIERAAAERAVQLSTEKYCGVHAMLVKAVPIEHAIVIHEGE